MWTEIRDEQIENRNIKISFEDLRVLIHGDFSHSSDAFSSPITLILTYFARRRFQILRFAPISVLCLVTLKASRTTFQESHFDL